MQTSSQAQEEFLQIHQVQVVPQCEIPLSDITFHAGGRLDFDQNLILKNFLPSPNQLSFSWLVLKPDEKISINSSVKTSALILCQGQAKLLSNGIEKNISTGDTILIPKQCSYELQTADNDLLCVLIQFSDKKTEALPQYPLTFEGLIQHNDARLQKISTNPYFIMLSSSSNVLEDPELRQKFLDSIQVFSDFFQHILFIRQGTCQDNDFHGIFLQHLREELGHDELLASRSHKHKSHDSILHATSMWFCNQMFILDNLEKAALVHLVLEVSGSYYHELARKKLGREAPDYYEAHNEVDDIHAKMGADLLKGHSGEVYRRLHNVIDKGWLMLDAMTRRVAKIVGQMSNGENKS